MVDIQEILDNLEAKMDSLDEVQRKSYLEGFGFRFADDEMQEASEMAANIRGNDDASDI